MAEGDDQREITKEVDTSTKLAYERTRLAYERTMQAWIRTATSLITFGFSVYKFFQLERPTGSRKPRLSARANSARYSCRSASHRW